MNTIAAFSPMRVEMTHKAKAQFAKIRSTGLPADTKYAEMVWRLVQIKLVQEEFGQVGLDPDEFWNNAKFDQFLIRAERFYIMDGILFEMEMCISYNCNTISVQEFIFRRANPICNNF